MDSDSRTPSRERSFGQRIELCQRRLAGAVQFARGLSPAVSPTEIYALGFALENAAWIALDAADAWALELRLGFPKRETETIDWLVRAERITLAFGRRLKQACEHRKLSSRDLTMVDWAALLPNLEPDFEIWDAWVKTLSEIGAV